MQQLRDRVGQATCANVVRTVNRVVRAERHAAVNDFLTAPLHLRVVALDAGKIECFVAVAGRHRTGGAAAQSDQHRWPAEHDHRVAGLEPEFLDLDAIHGAETTGQHDRLVVGTRQRGFALRRCGQLETAEVAEQIGAAELVVERGSAQRAIQHDLQRTCHARIEHALALPRLRQGRDAQVRDAESAQAGLGLAAPAGGPFVADLAAAAGRGAGKR